MTTRTQYLAALVRTRDTRRQWAQEAVRNNDMAPEQYDRLAAQLAEDDANIREVEPSAPARFY